MDKGLDQRGPCQKPGHTRGCRSMQNINIPETEYMKLVWAIGGREEDNLSRKVMDMVVPVSRFEFNDELSLK